MNIYTFSPAHIGTITDHTANLECVIVSITLMSGKYVMTTLEPLPDEQMAHLCDFTDIEAV